MKPTTYNLPSDLRDKIDQVARDSERSRSFVVRKLLERSLTGADRLAALEAIAADGLQAYADAASATRRPNATEIIAESCADGPGRLAALEKIAAGRK
jgi:predicted transcriptional regulator